ncbi:hypothetical protein [Sphingobacterium cellulitidis]|uniref:hypothetical protein n=1 Tax=Sphingobacterium cellulitidis TaxID=1768011 RepID=UPI000B93C744|nr:hypothetical protein [Sphingobacterium cellulitidis]OYD40230.1 hypothetical protein CHT99_19725 [Sphingobacterium cellulitidis]OYD44621.1 hypothetical protein CHU00_16005 [Sphingobacterium cellulitidis]
MNYNRLLLLIISLTAAVTMFYFLFGSNQANKDIGYFALLILLATNAIYFLFSKDWLKRE